MIESVPEKEGRAMRRCAVYRYIGVFGVGLVFIPLEYDHPTSPTRRYYHPPDYERLGEMDVDDTVLKFVKVRKGEHDEWEEANYSSGG